MTEEMTASGGEPDATVSVVVPVYNRAQIVPRALDSVVAQTFGDFELIVVDDASTDDLATALSDIKDPRIRVVRHGENRGAAASRNSGIGVAKGRYVAFLDSDDVWLPQKLERQLAFMRSGDKRTRASCTGYQISTPYSPEGEVRIAPPVLRERDLVTGCRMSPGSTLMAERSLFDDVGPMTDALRRLEDWDWLLRCAQITDIAILPDVLSYVDYSDTRCIDYESVRLAAQLMMSKHFVGSGLLPSFARIKFLAALENELAAAAYKNRRYGRALMHLTKSYAIYPYRSLDTLKRLGFAIFVDLRASVFGAGRK